MSVWEIQVDFVKIKALGEEIGQIAEHLQDIAENHGIRGISGVKAAWVGENADAFVAKEVKQINRLYEIAGSLKETAGQITQKAEQLYELEAGNVSLAKTRVY